MRATKTLRTPAEARADFEQRGISIAAWARQHGLNVGLVYEILQGNKRRRCLRGQSHRAAVLLGLKAGIAGDAKK